MLIKTIVHKNEDNYYLLEVDNEGNKLQRHDAKSATPYDQLLKWMWDKNLAWAITTSFAIRHKPYASINLFCEKKDG